MTEAVDDQTERDPTAAVAELPSEDVTSPTEAAAETGTAGETGTIDEPGGQLAEIDVAGIEADLDGVQAALGRLADGTYWTDEVTGEPIPTEILHADPLARRA